VKHNDQDLALAKKKFALDVANYSATKKEVIMLKAKIEELEIETLEHKKVAQLSEMQAYTLKCDNDSLKSEAEMWRGNINSLQLDMELIKSTEGNAQRNLDALLLEFHQYKSEYCEAATQIDHLQIRLQESQQLLEAEKALKEEVQKQLDYVTLDREKLQKRQKELESEHRDVAHHVHDYYATINKLERQLAESEREKGNFE
jgi:chromosome segregation ATPase